jgi:hypothetical protein
MAAWSEAEAVEDEELRQELLAALHPVSGELHIGRQARPEVRRRSLATIREVRQRARAAGEAEEESLA